MITESIDKVQLPDQIYRGFWMWDKVTMPFVGYDINFDVFDYSESEVLCSVSVANGYCLVKPLTNN